MASPAVRIIGRLTDADGTTVRVGVDCDAVTVRGGGTLRLDAGQRKEFSRLYAEAERQAVEWAKAWGPGDAG